MAQEYLGRQTVATARIQVSTEIVLPPLNDILTC